MKMMDSLPIVTLSGLPQPESWIEDIASHDGVVGRCSDMVHWLRNAVPFEDQNVTPLPTTGGL